MVMISKQALTLAASLYFIGSFLGAVCGSLIFHTEIDMSYLITVGLTLSTFAFMLAWIWNEDGEVHSR